MATASTQNSTTSDRTNAVSLAHIPVVATMPSGMVWARYIDQRPAAATAPTARLMQGTTMMNIAMTGSSGSASQVNEPGVIPTTTSAHPVSHGDGRRCRRLGTSTATTVTSEANTDQAMRPALRSG